MGNDVIGTARRVHQREAHAAFNRGETIAVSDRGHEPSFDVYRTTTVHSADSTTWTDLLEQVQTWRNRYSNQRYYIVDYGSDKETQ